MANAAQKAESSTLMGTQNSDSVNISGGTISGVTQTSTTQTGGTIDNTPIGSVTPSTGSFTYIQSSTASGLSAAGSSRVDALQLAATNNFLSAVVLNTGVVLPSAASVGVGCSVFIFNAGANPVKVYGSGSDTIDGTAGATGVTLTNAKRCEYIVSAAATWISAQLGVVSA